MTSSWAHEFWEAALLGIVLCMIMNASPMMLMLMLMLMMLMMLMIKRIGD
jgi:hypothetical protein